MKVSFELSPRDIRFFRDRLKQVRASASASNEEVVIQGAVDLVQEAIAAEPPDFVIERIRKLEQLIEMLRDRDWRLEGSDRVHILDAIAYFVDPDDLIPDRIPGIGYIDDAIMVELVANELTHEIEAYEDFCEFRKRCAKTDAPNKLEARRKSLQARMRRRSRRERSSKRRGSSSSRVRLW